ncbi:MAG: hypothetical protein R3212_06325, partial [Xanthomonadales bacterium]|nr:hypothetical protein [Xanthomonadales bacterium]
MNEPTTSGPDWRRKVVREAQGDSYATEGREWLPIVLGGLFIAIVVAALVWLLLDPDGEEALSPETARAVAESEAQLPAPRSTSEERSRWQAAL